MDCVKIGEALPVNFASPLYVAVMECDFAARLAVANDAVSPVSVTVPNIAVPSLKVTLPVGVPELVG